MDSEEAEVEAKMIYSKTTFLCLGILTLNFLLSIFIR